MKKTLWLALILLMVCVFAFSACYNGDTPSANDDVCQHAFGDWNTTKQATCKDEGKLVRTCSKCSAEEKTTVAKTNVHAEVIDVAVSSTCKTNGKTEGKHCFVCGVILVEQNSLPLTNHTYDNDEDPKCNICNFVRDVNCKHTKIEILEAVAPTCTTDGLTEGKKCTVCEEIILAQTTKKALGHIEVIDSAVAPTCTETGLTQGKHCTRCTSTLIEQTTVNALGHSWNDATCVDPKTCSKCGATEGETVQHNYINGNCISCGEKDPTYVVNWSFEDGVLTIYGKGPMEDGNRPWSNYLSIVTKIIISDGITHIGNNSFSGCQNVKSVEISDSVISIGKEAFAFCTYLTDLKLSNNLVKIETSAFDSCTHLTDFEIPDSVIEIKSFAFENCRSLTKIELNNSNIQLDAGVFRECVRLTSVSLPNGIKEISNWLFSQCTALSNVTIPDSVNTIGEYAFYYCESLSTIEVSGNVKSVGIFAFGFCKRLKSIKFCDGVENLAGLMFRGCSNLKKVEIPTSVAYIGTNLFEACHKDIAIYGESGSYAETYANVNGYKFISQ